jgi:hypothetical protein
LPLALAELPESFFLLSDGCDVCAFADESTLAEAAGVSVPWVFAAAPALA